MNCNNKNKYFSEDEANDTAKHQLETNGVKLRSYHCHECGWWHLTKNLNYISFIRKNKSISKIRKNSKESFSFLFKKYFK